MLPTFSLMPTWPALSLAAPLLLACAPPSHGAESRPKVAVVAFGLYGDQSVFASEASRAAKIVADRFGSNSVVVNSNTKHENANSETLTAALRTISKTMDPENDVLFLILTSHGSQAGLEVKAGTHDDVLSPLNLVTALNNTSVRYRVVVISACYSGVFARPLADPNTLVISAADADHSSFGCKNGNEWTYFGDAFFNMALRHTTNLRDAFAEASALLRKREHQRHFEPSNPQMAGGENVEHVLNGEHNRVVAYSRDGGGFEPKYAFSRGVAAGAKGNYDDAIVAYKEAISFNPKDSMAYNNRGVAYFRNGDNDHAIADYSESIRLNPKIASAYANRGRAYREKGDYGRAIVDYDKAIALDARFAAAYNNRGLTYGAKGDSTHAIADYTKAIKLDPKLANAYENRGRAFRAGGDDKRAISDFEEAIRLDPKLADTLKTLSMKKP